MREFVKWLKKRGYLYWVYNGYLVTMNIPEIKRYADAHNIDYMAWGTGGAQLRLTKGT